MLFNIITLEVTNDPCILGIEIQTIDKDFDPIGHRFSIFFHSVFAQDAIKTRKGLMPPLQKLRGLWLNGCAI